MADSSASKAVCWPPRLRAISGPSPLWSSVISQPRPAASRSVQAWPGCPPMTALSFDHGVFSRTREELVSTCRPSLMSRLLSLASENHLGIRCRLESSVALLRLRKPQFGNIRESEFL
jgi:hypothetical protein